MWSILLPNSLHWCGRVFYYQTLSTGADVYFTSKLSPLGDQTLSTGADVSRSARARASKAHVHVLRELLEQLVRLVLVLLVRDHSGHGCSAADEEVSRKPFTLRKQTACTSEVRGRRCGRGQQLIMGGGGSKQAQLERYGQLLSPAERQALEATFHEIAGTPDASSLTEKQLTVSSSKL